MLFQAIAREVKRVHYHTTTAALFTVADIKTILVPITVFACATAPLHSPVHLLSGVVWTWFHQLMCNVSNQARSSEEDAVNKPWRPIPTSRITTSQALMLRWLLVGMCIAYSAVYGVDVALASFSLFITTFVYDELGFAGHYIGKNFCNIGGYVSLEVGATKLVGAVRDFDQTSIMACILSGALIFTTIQAQDFADVEGDKLLGRVTIPIWAPELSRVGTLLLMCAWSLFLPWYWEIGAPATLAFLALGTFVGLRYYLLRHTDADKRSYVLYNVWLVFAHIMPLKQRLWASM
ncbi:UbiA prenyltransferase family [Cubamyces lactineus]|nr:UbiA prenyltransferase family [Cubamyces lactineus]